MSALNLNDLVRWVRARLQTDICLDDAMLDFIEGTFGIRDLFSESDLEESETASLLDLLFYPDQRARLAFEEHWGANAFSPGQVETLTCQLVEAPITTLLRKRATGRAISIRVPDFAISAFIERLKLTWQPPARLNDILHMALRPPEVYHARARLRSCRFDWHDGRLLFLSDFLDRIAPTDEDFDTCLEFLLHILGEFGPGHDPFEYLMAKKLFYFQALCRSEAFERLMRVHAMETIMLQGVRAALGDAEQWRTAMRQADRIGTALYGRTRFFQRPAEHGPEAGSGAEGTTAETFLRRVTASGFGLTDAGDES